MVKKPDGWPVLVTALRDAAEGIREAAVQMDNEKVYFPPRLPHHRKQPVKLVGYVSLNDVAELIQYIADMLEP